MEHGPKTGIFKGKLALCRKRINRLKKGWDQISIQQLQAERRELNDMLIKCQTIEFLQKDFKAMYSSLKQRQYIDTITS